MKKTSSYSQASIFISRIHWTFQLLLPGPTLLDCCHPALTQSECEGNVPTAYTYKDEAIPTLQKEKFHGLTETCIFIYNITSLFLPYIVMTLAGTGSQYN